ncbi:hypothetical protein WMF38_38545 [Sorangium sp. So ce118]
MGGAIAWFFGAAGLFTGIYFYQISKRDPELTYYVHPVQAAVVKTGQASRLAVSHDGNPIDSDITAAQVVIWNNGKQSIKKDSVLKAIKLELEDETPILEATVRKVSRDVIGFTIQTDELSKGRASVSWNILEQDDGAVLQLVYAGKPGTQIQVSGIIEGQKQLERYEYHNRILSPDEQYQKKKPRWYLWLGLVLIAGLSTFAIVPLVHGYRELANKRRISKNQGRSLPIGDMAGDIAILGLGTALLILIPIVLAYTIKSLAADGPPFGF